MAEKTNTEISELAVGGPGLSFIGMLTTRKDIARTFSKWK